MLRLLGVVFSEVDLLICEVKWQVFFAALNRVLDWVTPVPFVIKKIDKVIFCIS
jgi:hypothetical protein